MKKFITTIKNIFSIEELRNRILATLGFLVIFRLGSFVVLPGVDPTQLSDMDSGIFGILNAMLGGSFSRASIFGLATQLSGNESNFVMGFGIFISHSLLAMLYKCCTMESSLNKVAGFTACNLLSR